MGQSETRTLGVAMATQAQIDALEAAYVSGVKEYTYEGKRVVYHSMAEMREALTYLKAELARPVGRPRARFGLVSFSRGDR